ncbi:hypothetical protein H4R33_002645 [Dimargaris cristalligena]|uniref:COX assembly mitochondrial protein n=1 Tax=Dimargaris cristalligena TaxID=215637 RepID=A0A4P9ZZJ7_9FUNG|nr:hypothetical protein H4R33_002645 [Dimargaris cristalligena]RKP38372.1 hypothetical protein BJ085DRAFT_24703 [Dimargaris cristalligena]|eukprot:RKP38372.1 hypothetical protein BJ085DRAFT_24703 [Dimargaris cristalligena]
MHPQLSEHKTPQCADLIQKLNACHEQRNVAKFFGACNDLKNELTLCLRADRKERSRKNLDAARKKKAEVDRAWKDIEEGK